ncbi:MAG: geranylgeranyl reductase family protein [Actinomycetota bacterium]|nr:geranylgeranyl reductase family protein [Actinomycetota bacterium]MDI6821847.1 geranylgeranyl reductase family protein [Actinomycetota bacterium]
MDFEVAIVGAGPGGSSAAYYLSKLRHKVLLVDKCQFPRDKACGDGISPRAVEILKDMGLLPEIEGKFKRTRGVRIFATKGGCMEANWPHVKKYPHYGFIIPRIELDDILRRHAIRAGAEFWDNCLVIEPLLENGKVIGVRAKRNGRHLKIYSSFVIAADGAHSRVGRSLRLLKRKPRSIGVAIRAYYQGIEDDDFMEIYGEDCILPAFGWIFPAGNGIANVGVGALIDDVKKHQLNLSYVLSNFIHNSAHARKKLTKAIPLDSPKGDVLRLGWEASEVATNGVLLVGDAASLVNPFTGEGVTYALESGKLAAEVIDEALSSGDPTILFKYKDLIRRRYGFYFRMGTIFVKWISKPPLMNLGIGLASKNQKLAQFSLRVLANLLTKVV